MVTFRLRYKLKKQGAGHKDTLKGLMTRRKILLKMTYCRQVLFENKPFSGTSLFSSYSFSDFRIIMV